MVGKISRWLTSESKTRPRSKPPGPRSNSSTPIPRSYMVALASGKARPWSVVSITRVLPTRPFSSSAFEDRADALVERPGAGLERRHVAAGHRPYRRCSPAAASRGRHARTRARNTRGGSRRSRPRGRMAPWPGPARRSAGRLPGRRHGPWCCRGRRRGRSPAPSGQPRRAVRRSTRTSTRPSRRTRTMWRSGWVRR